jgi:hypothetical protein
MDDGRLCRALERIAVAVEKLAGIEPPAKPAPPTGDRVTAHRGSRVPDEPDDRGLIRGGIPPSEFFARRERD